MIDFAPPVGRRGERRTEAASLKLARGMTVVWGIVLVAIGMLARHWGSVLESGLSIASVTLGLLLGVFLLGVLTRRVREWAAIAGVLAGLAAVLYVRFATPIAWTWWVADRFEQSLSPPGMRHRFCNLVLPRFPNE